MNWNEKAIEGARERLFDPIPTAQQTKAVFPFTNGARWMRDQLRTNEANERVARALNGAGWVCMGCEYEPYDFDECESCRDVCLKQARTAITALLGDN